MLEEATVLGGYRGIDKRRWQLVRRHPGRPAAIGAPRLVQQFAVPVHDRHRLRMLEIEQARRQRTEPHIAEASQCHSQGGHRETAAEGHRVTSMVCVAARPDTSGEYISSARDGATVNVPAVVARTTYENSWCPSASRVANNSTRSSWRST